MSDAPDMPPSPRRWQTGTLAPYSSPHWEALSAPDAAALVAFTDAEATAACAIAREHPPAIDRAGHATYRRALALWCTGARDEDLQRASLAHIDALPEGILGPKPVLTRDSRSCVRWCQAAILTLWTHEGCSDDALLRAGRALVAGGGADCDEQRYSVAQVCEVLSGGRPLDLRGVRVSEGSTRRRL
jgi:hypothetical protein